MKDRSKSARAYEDAMFERRMGSAQTRHHYTKKPSANVKTGPVTVTRTTTGTCPKSCPLLGNGCYDQQGNGNIHRRRVDSGQYETLSVSEFMREIRNFTQLYRHNEGGDLWNGKTSEHICADTLKTFATTNRFYKRTPIVYTHKACVGSRSHWAIRRKNREAIQNSGAGFAINTSVESLVDVDEALDHGLDCVVVLPADTGKGVTKTPGGNRVVTCPATYGSIQCISCGAGKPLCTRKGRGYAIGFPAHGSSQKKITLRILKG